MRTLTRASDKAWRNLGKGKAVTSKSSLRILKRSMAYRVEIVPRAQRDLLHLFERINARSSDAALIWYRGLKDAMRSLQDNPQRCPTTPECKRLRHLLYGNKPNVYRLIYRIVESNKEVDIIHI